jgi:hypothetical protein
VADSGRHVGVGEDVLVVQTRPLKIDSSGWQAGAREQRREPFSRRPAVRREMHELIVAEEEDALLELENRCAHRSRIFSNTGALSAIEPLITLSTSAVAVCCSSASWVSLKRRAFSIAITAWSAKVLSRAISLGRNGARLLRETTIAPMPRSSSSKGANRTTSIPVASMPRRAPEGTSGSSTLG